MNELNTYTHKDLVKIDVVLKGEHGEIWLFDTTPGAYRYKCYSEDTSLMRRINNWDESKRGDSYHRKDGVMITYDVIIPRKMVKRACRVLGIKFKKDPDLVAHGNRMASKLIPFSKKGKNNSSSGAEVQPA